MILTALRNLSDSLYQIASRYKHRIRWIAVVLITLGVMVLYNFDVFERLELLTSDLRFMLRPAKPHSSEIVFIDMSEDSINAIGRWPWPRRWHAALIAALSEYRPKAIALDVIFSEPQDQTDDLALEEAIKNSQVVYLPVSYETRSATFKGIYKGDGIASVLEPIPPLRRWIKGTGHINAMPDIDGVIRRVPPFITYEGMTTYQFGLKIGADAAGLKNDGVKFYPQKNYMQLTYPDGRIRKVPLDKNNQLIINWQGKWGRAFKHFSYIDVIKSYAAIKDGKKPLIDLNLFKDKICIVGLTALGLIDIKPVPIENAYPAVGINAMVVDSVLKGDFVYEAPKIVNMFLILFVSLFVSLYLSRFKIVGGILLSAISMVGYALFSFLIFNFFNVMVSVFYPIFAIFLSYSASSLYVQVLQSIERSHLFRQATRDGLTGLYNVRHFNLLLEAEFRNASLYKFRRLAVIMGDVDNFKHINDTYGHQAGDEILREVSKAIQSRCRQTDIAARYGGEEFIVMLTGAGEKEAAEVAEKVRTAVESKKFKFKNDSFHPTISIGVVQYSTETSKEELVERADRALYKAKHEGKNRVCLSSTVTS